jgi:hypothetical protein
MYNKIITLEGLKEIIIVDNESNSTNVKEWYSKLNCRIIYLSKNIGHTAPWLTEVLNYVTTDYYFVTDPDLEINNLPSDTLFHLASLLSKYPNFKKVGLELENPKHLIKNKKFRNTYESENFYHSLPIINNEYREAYVDTTFAVYNKNILNKYEVCGIRTIYPYTAKHLPWYDNQINFINSEYDFYLKSASNSSSILNSLSNG